MKSHLSRVPAFLFACTLAACGGGGGGTPTSPPQPSQSFVTGNLTLGLAAKSASARAGRFFLSPSAASVSIAVTGVTQPVVADISATSAQCTTTGPTRSCTIPITAPVGNDTFTATLYSAANAGGAALGSGISTLAIAAGAPFSIAIGVNGMVDTIALTATQTTFAAGTAATTTLAVSALDAGGNAIVGTYATPIQLTNSDASGTFTISPTTIANSTTVVTLAYSGGTGATTATISANAVNVPVAKVAAQILTVTPATGLNMYVSQIGSKAFTVTPTTANGNVPPIRTVAGSNTQLTQPYGIAVDTSGVEYVSGLGSAITEYAAGANGNVAPIRTISGGNTGLSAALGLGFDTTGNLYVTNFSAQSVTVYAPGADGNATPIRTISGSNTGIGQPYGLALDPANNLYVVNDKSQFGGVDSLTEYAPGANGNVAPIRTITGNATGMSLAVFVAIDAAGNAYVTNANTNSITVYDPLANGNSAPIRTISVAKPTHEGLSKGNAASVRSVSGPSTTLNRPAGIVFDAAGNLYVVNDGNNTLVVFAPGATGNATPIRTLAGSAIGFSGADQIFLAP